MKTKSGFTIVELLVVIVVIAILATITMLSYAATQNQGKTSAGQSLASNVADKVQSYHTLNSVYPTYCQLTTNTTDGAGPIPCTTGAVSAGDEAKLDDPSVLQYSSSAAGAGYTKTISNANKVVGYYLCGASVGADVFYYDYSNYKIASVKVGSGC